MRRDKKRIQRYLYGRREYNYRITAASIRRYEEEQHKDAERGILENSQELYRLLYYCTEWKGAIVDEGVFMKDCKTGLVRMRPGKNEYYGIGLKQLFLRQIREFKRHFRL